MEPINFYLGDESRLVIDDFKSKNESLFKDSYDKALNVIYDFIQDSKKNENEVDKDSASVFFRQTADSVKNNVVAFLGDRGTGKTSCMLSVANMLRKISEGENDEKGKKIKSSCEKGFEILETIDPSFFDENANILEIVLGRLFSKFNDIVKKGNCYDHCKYDSEKDKLFEQFQNVKESLSQMKAKKCICEDDNVEDLLKLTASVNMRNDIQKLVSQYLEFIDKDYLIISIDDLDMHTEHAYDMAEEIRKYLKQPKIIVLTALKLEQLEQAIELHYSNHYDKMIGKGLPSSEISDMALKYVIKLIPENNRIYMPESRVWSDSLVNVYIEDVYGDKEHKEKKWKLQDARHINQTVKYYVTSMIFQKTRYLFYHSKDAVSPIVPRNLRELRQLIDLLCKMKDYSKDASNKINQISFKNYFLNTWATNSLSNTENKIIRDFFSISDISLINKTIVKKLVECYSKYFADYIASDSHYLLNIENEVAKIIDEKNVSYNISLGDALYIINYLEKIITSNEDKAFLFAIKTFYSIRLYEYYNMRTEYNLIELKKNLNSTAEYSIVKRNSLDELSAYEVLVGGAFANIENNDERIIPSKNNIIRRDFGTINLDTFKDLKFDNDDINKKNIKKIRLLEFFLLFISRNEYKSQKKAGLPSDDKYRLTKEIYYNSKINAGKCIFNLFSIFFNLTNIKRQYERYDENFCKFVTKEETDSLYNRIRSFCHNHRYVVVSDRESEKNADEHRLLSWASIRNIDVLDELIRASKYTSILAQNERKALYQDNKKICNNDDLNHIFSFLIKMKNFNINSYDLDTQIQKKRYHDINFRFFEVLTNYLSEEVSKDNGFTKIFDTLNEKNEITLEEIDDSQTLTRGEVYRLLENRDCSRDSIKPHLGKKRKFTKKDVLNIISSLNGIINW